MVKHYFCDTSTCTGLTFNFNLVYEALNLLRDWQVCVKKYDRPHTLFYLDPPYWQTAGYGFPFDWEQYVAMKELMLSMKGKCILSINKHPDIELLFKDFRQASADINYIVGGNLKVKKATELIIYNY